MRITLCPINYRHASYYLKQAELMGYQPIEDWKRGEYMIRILADSRAPYWRGFEEEPLGNSVQLFEFGRDGKLVARTVLSNCN